MVKVNVEIIKNNKYLYSLFYFYDALVKQSHFNFFKYLRNMKWYVSDLKDFMKIKEDKKSQKILSLMPYIKDKSESHGIDYVYFLQDAWVALKIFNINPERHVDVGSSLKTMSIISQKIPVTFVDIRRTDVELEGLKYVKGSIIELPFNSKSIKSLSSVCVIEHIGLGRYGDKIDPEGDKKAAQELQRVLKGGGDLFVTVPVDKESGVRFNAHRTYTRATVLSLFDKCKLVEEKYIYGKRYYKKYIKSKGFGTGLFHFRKFEK